MRKSLGILGVLTVVLGGLFAYSPVLAASCGGVETSIISCEEGEENGEAIWAILGMVVNILTAGIGILAVLGIVISGYQYMTAAGDPGKMAQAKNRIFQVVIGLLIYAVMWSVIEFLIPGGLF